MKSVWSFTATCHTCGAAIPVKATAGEFQRQAEHWQYVITLDNVEIEAHMLLEHAEPEKAQ